MEFLYSSKSIQNILKNPINHFSNLSILSINLTEEELYHFRGNNIPNVEKSIYDVQRNNDSLKKIAFVSNDFTLNRPSGQLAESFFSFLSNYKDYFDIYLYTQNPEASTYYNEYGTLKILDVDKIADEIYTDNIDILFDMQGHMQQNYNKILMKKPAPIQVHWLGYPGTLGIPNVDYLIADSTIIPKESVKYYHENIAYMPDCYQVNNEMYLTNKYTPNKPFVLCCFHSNYKYNKSSVSFWISLVQKIKHAKLILYCKEDLRVNVRNWIHDLKLNSKVVIENYMEKEPHIKRLSEYHVGLDAFAVNGHTTTSDCIAAGIPVVTLTTETYHNRVSKSILKTLHLDELVCNTMDEYENKVIQLATDPKYYKHIKETLLENRSKVLFNTPLYVRNFVNLMYSMWNKHVNHAITEIPQVYVDSEYNSTITKDSPLLLLEDIRPCILTSNTDLTWCYHSNKTIIGSKLAKVSISGEQLHSLAKSNKHCVAYTTDGELKYKLGELVHSDDTGIWIKTDMAKKLPLEKSKLDYRSIVYKQQFDIIDGDLPKICLVCVADHEEQSDRMLNFFKIQQYTNISVIIFHTFTYKGKYEDKPYCTFIPKKINTSIHQEMKYVDQPFDYFIIFDSKMVYAIDCVYEMYCTYIKNKTTSTNKNMSAYIKPKSKYIQRRYNMIKQTHVYA